MRRKNRLSGAHGSSSCFDLGLPARRWVEWRLDKDEQSGVEQHRVQMEWKRFREERGRDWQRMVCASASRVLLLGLLVFCPIAGLTMDPGSLWDGPRHRFEYANTLVQFDDESSQRNGFNRGSESWWRQKHYDQEFVGSNGVQSMSRVQEALRILEVTAAAHFVVLLQSFCPFT